MHRIDPDVVHAILPWHYHSYSFLLQCFRLGYPVLVTYQLVAPNRSPPSNQAAFIRKACQSSRFTISAVSNDNRYLLSNYFSVDPFLIPVIPNRPTNSPLPYLNIKVARESFRKYQSIDSDAQIILTVAALEYQKGLDILVKSAAIVLKSCPLITFCIAGDGSYRQELEELVNRHNINGSFRFLGRRNDINQLLRIADYFFFPTRFEGGESFALLEAAEACLPIIASKASGIPETFRDKIDAVLFSVDDVTDAANKLLFALCNRDSMISMALTAKKRVREYTSNDMLRDTAALIAKIACC